MALTVTCSVKGSGLKIDVKLPSKDIPRQFKLLSGIGIRDRMDEQYQKGVKDLEKAPADKKRAMEPGIDMLAAQIWYIDFYKSVNNVAKIHYRVFVDVGGQQVELARTSAPAGEGPAAKNP